MKKKLLASVLALTLTVSQILPLGPVKVNAADALNTNAAEAPAAPEAFGPTPSAGQMKYYKDELSAFLHFGVNTFTGSEWGNGKEDPDVFNPTDLSTDQWIQVLKDAGFKRAILTTKHHDGFALFPTKYSPNKRSVESSIWRDGKGDVVKDFVESCAKYDMDIGFYLSPWDVGNPEYPADSGRDYNDIYVGQMNELFDYANSVGKPVTEFWLDGANGGNNRPKYDIQRWWDEMEKHNPDIVYQQNYGAPLRWCGNESGYSADTCWHILDYDYVWNLYDQHGQEDAGYLHVGEPYDPASGKNYVWSISEVDVSLHSGWFWHNSQTKSVEKLMDMYFDSVGLGSPFLLNVPPNKEGRIDDADVAVLEEFRDILDNTFTKNYVTEETAAATATETRGNHVNFGAQNVVDDDYDTYWTMDDGKTTGSVTVELDKPELIDVIQIQEYIPLGQRIASFKTEVRSNGQWVEFGKGGTIGYKRLVKGAPVMADAIRVTVTDAKAVPLINDISAFKADERIEEEAKMVPGRIQAESCDKLSGAISENKGPNGGGNLGAVGNGATAEYNSIIFNQIPKTFTLCYSGAGTPQITLRLDSANGPILGQMTVENPGGYDKYVTKTVPVTYDGEPITGMHTIVLCMNAGLNVDWFELTGANTFEISPKKAEVYEGDAVELTITRSDEDLSEEVTVTVQDTPDTAVQGQDYEPVTEELTFAPNETTKTVTIQTVVDDKKATDLKFNIELQNPSSNAMVGKDKKTVITILDLDSPADKTELEDVLHRANGKVEEDYTPDSWAEFVKVREEAEALMDKADANRKELDAMVQRLNAAMENLVDFQYGEGNPVVFPTKEGDKIITEAEDYQLHPLAGASGNRIQIEAPGWCQCSKGLGVGWWANGDYMTAPVKITKPGTYTIGFRYGSGSRDDARNTVRLTGTGIETADIVFVPNTNSGTCPDWQYADITVTEEAVKAGAEIKIEAIANGGPLLDQVSVELKEAAVEENIPIDEVHFPDPVLRQDMKSSLYDKNQDGILSAEELKNTSVSVTHNRDPRIEDLTGLEYFTELESLTVKGNSFETLDLSVFPKLKTLKCDSMKKLDHLILSGNPELETLNCSDAGLEELDVSNNPKLTDINCMNNMLETLDVSNNPQLLRLNCSANNISELDVSNNPELTSLTVSRNPLGKLDVSSNLKLKTLICEFNGLTTLDVSRNTELTSLDVMNNGAVPENCVPNRLEALDLTNNTKLTTVKTGGNRLLSLVIPQDAKLMTGNTQTRTFVLDSDSRSIDLKELDPAIDVSRITEVKNAVLDGTVLKNLRPGTEATYEYNTRDAKSDWESTGNYQMFVKFVIEGEPADYTVTVNGGTLADGSTTGQFVYNDTVTLTADAPAEGKVFVGWQIAGSSYNKGFVSTDNPYKFYVSEDVELNAVYRDAEAAVIETEALLTNVMETKRADGKYDMKFVGQIVLPKDYTIEKAGLVWSSNKDAELAIGADGARPTYITRISDTNQFSVTIKGVPEGRFVRGRIFVQVKDDQGQTLDYIYSIEEKALTETCAVK